VLLVAVAVQDTAAAFLTRLAAVDVAAVQPNKNT
jgi:hypothetical protein